MKKIIIFGATGTLGLYLVDYFAEKLDNNWQIIATGRKECSFFEKHYGSKVKYNIVDINSKDSFKSIDADNIHVIYHFAGELPAYMEGYDPYAYLDSNIVGTFNVLEFAKSHNNTRVVFAQTISDYQGYFGEMTELMDDMPPKVPYSGDHSVYAISKVTAWQLCLHYMTSYGLPVFGIRIPNIYCYMPESKTLYQDGKKKMSSYRYMIKLAMEGKDIEQWGNPNSGMDLIYIKDFCQLASLFISTDEKTCGMYNVGTGKLTTITELIEGIVDVFCEPEDRSKIIYKPEKHNCVDYFMNVDKAKKLLGYNPEYTSPTKVFSDYKKEMQDNRFANFFRDRYGTERAYL